MSDILREVAREALENREVVERIDYPTCLMNQLHYCQLALSLAGWKTFCNAVIALYTMLTTESDEQFEKEIRSATLLVKRRTGKYYKDIGPTPSEIIVTEERFDYIEVFRACLGLMKRKGLLLHERKMEIL